MNNLKNAYKDNNTIIETNEVKKNDGTRKLKDGSLTQKQLELEAVEDKAVEMMPEILQINDMANLIEQDQNLGEETVENYVEAVVAINSDMKILAANAYQL